MADVETVGHTPVPWDYVASTEHHGPYITSGVGGTIADLYTMSFPSEPSTANGGRSKPVPFYHEMADPNAAFIVKAVNNFDALVKALQKIRDNTHGIPDWKALEMCRDIAREALTQAGAA